MILDFFCKLNTFEPRYYMLANLEKFKLATD